MHIGSIGTAGRKDNAAKLTGGLFSQMENTVEQLISTHTPIHLISGGAAVADHIAVRLFLTHPEWRLTLHFPAPFECTQHAFTEKGSYKKLPDAGSTANYYHRKFQKRCGINSLQEIAEALNKGATQTLSPGFFQRNSRIDREADTLIALTFGHGARVKPGGTADTLRKFLNRNRSRSIHIDCNTLQPYQPTEV